MPTARLIRIRITPIDMGFFRATSRDLPGLYAAEKTREKLMAELPTAIAELLGMDGARYEVGAPEQLDEDTYLWRAVEVAHTNAPLRRAC